MDLHPDARTWWTYGAVVAGLLVIHLAASGGTFTIKPAVHHAVGVTPATTLSRWYNHLWAGLFHTTPVHIGFNLTLFSLAYFFAARANGPFTTLAAAYAIGPTVVLLLHLAVVRPLAAHGSSYAASAMDLPLVGFSVMAYAVAGMALASSASPLWRWALSACVVAFESAAGIGRFTAPFIFTYHLAGFGAGAAVQAWFLSRGP